VLLVVTNVVGVVVVFVGSSVEYNIGCVVAVVVGK
jgi:hypothetical protein